MRLFWTPLAVAGGTVLSFLYQPGMTMLAIVGGVVTYVATRTVITLRHARAGTR